ADRVQFKFGYRPLKSQEQPAVGAARIINPVTVMWIPTEAGRGFRFDVGHRSDMKPATLPI
ncbi:hypothetical protein, partial [Acidocella sp.]|uniref:hypothetical protein n=1 Tax=Acidocella sp. TaxID=50710 RepID=UPI0025C13347